MKYFFTFTILSITEKTFAQLYPPDFLQGTWKIENQEIYEHWDKLNDNTLKGFSYKVIDGQMIVSEYLDIVGNGDEIIYTATVLDQNQGKGIDFKLTKSDSAFTFENPEHDFPKKIVYQKLTNTEIAIQVSDGNQKGYTFRMKKRNELPIEEDSTISNPNYDPVLAKNLGADDYGMKSYILVILKTGSNLTTSKNLVTDSFRGHLDNINRLVAQKKLIVAGPLVKNDRNYRGIFILNNVATLEDAKELLQADPAIKVGLLDVELYNWYGSAALPEYLEFSDKIWKAKP